MVGDEPVGPAEAALRPVVGLPGEGEVRLRAGPLVEADGEQRRVRGRNRVAVAVRPEPRPEDPARAGMGVVRVPAVGDERRRCYAPSSANRGSPSLLERRARSRGCRRCRPPRCRRTAARTPRAGRAQDGCRRRGPVSRAAEIGRGCSRGSPRAPARTARPARGRGPGRRRRTSGPRPSRSSAASPSRRRGPLPGHGAAWRHARPAPLRRAAQAQ